VGGVHGQEWKFDMSIAKARNLRIRATESERKLWELLRKRQIHGHRFRRQFPIGPFIADFVCLERRVIIEVDGDIHESPGRRDADIERDMWLASQRFRVLRLTNEVVMTDRELTRVKIETFLGMSHEAIVDHPLPGPPPSRGREKSGYIRPKH
jgi:very-short-patch-repair endonuclease